MDGTVEQDLDSAKLRSLAKQRTGVVIDGVGELEAMVGLGSIGAVYRVTNASGRRVAVKIMHEHIKANDNLRDRFMREATILDQVDHPNAVEVYGTGEAETGEKYFVMELLEGEEVAAIWRREGPFGVEKAFKIAEQTLDCLAAYHRAEVLHRDLKPANLFLTHQGLVKLIDFGLARFRVEGRAKTRAGVTMGTPAYMAPEQALGRQEQIDVRTDVFGLGAVLYELISGRTIHELDSVEATLVQAATSRPDSLAAHASDLPEEAVAIVDKSIAHNREDRYQSAAAMRDAIRSFLDLESPSLELEEGTEPVAPRDIDESSASGSAEAESPADGGEFPEDDSIPGMDDNLEELSEEAMDEALGAWDENEIDAWEEQSSADSAEDTGADTSEASEENPSILMEAEELENRIETGSYDTIGADEPVPDATPDLMRMIAAVRDEDDDELFEALEAAVEKIQTAGGRSDQRLAWRIRPHSLELDSGDEHVFDGDLEDIPEKLQAAGFHRLMIDASVTDGELSTFVRWLAIDTLVTLPGEDDLATRFRELDVDAVGAGIFPMFQWDDRGGISFDGAEAHGELADAAVRYLHGRQGMWQGLEDLTANTDPSGFPTVDGATSRSVSIRVDSHASGFLRTPKGVLSMDVAKALDEAMISDRGDWDHQIGVVFADIWNNGSLDVSRPERTLRELVGDYVDRKLGREVVDWLAEACRRLEDDDTRRSFVGRAFEDVKVDRVIEMVEEGLEDDDPERDAIAERFAGVAEHLPSSRRAEIIATYEFGDEFTRRVLRPYRERFEVSGGGNIETADTDLDELSDIVAAKESIERRSDEEAIDWRRAFAGEVYRLFRVAVFDDKDGEDRQAFAGDCAKRLGRLFSMAPDQLSILFADGRILVDGMPLQGSPSSYNAIGNVGAFLEEYHCNEIVVDEGVTREDVEALGGLLRRLERGDEGRQPPYTPGDRIQLRETDPAVRFGMVDPLVGEDPIEMRMGRYYAACVTTLRQYLRTPPERRSEWFSTLKRMSQVWVRLSKRSRPTTLALTGLDESGDDPAACMLDAALLSILMARRLSGRAETLGRIAFGALVSDPTSVAVGDDFEAWNSAAECAAAVMTNARTELGSLQRAVTAYEIIRLFGDDAEGLAYGESVTPRVEALLVGIAREFATRVAKRRAAGESASPREVVEAISEHKKLRVERYLLHLLVDTVGLFTRGMYVQLSSGWRGVVLEAKDHVTDFHLPVVRLLRNPQGEEVSSVDVDLADDVTSADKFGYAVRRIEDVDAEKANDIKDSMTDSMMQE